MFLSSSKIADFAKIRRDVHYLATCFREVLIELGEQTLASAVPWTDLLQSSSPTQGSSREPATEQDLSATPPPTADLQNDDCLKYDTLLLTQLYSIAFQLLNMVEENAIVQYRRHLESQHQVVHFSGLWDQAFLALRDNGLSEDEIASALASTRVEPVLTAHPTEAKRFTVLEQHRALYLLLVRKENPLWTPLEQGEIRSAIKSALERLWRTGEIYLEKPDVSSEVRNVLYYLRNVFPEVLAVVDARVRAAWREAGFKSETLSRATALPQLSFGSWVGGDRDGHPFVTPEVTTETLLTMRAAAIDLVREQLIGLVQRLSLSSRLQPPPERLRARLQELVAQLGKPGELALQRNPDEPWRQLINVLLIKLPDAETTLAQEGLQYVSADELLKDLQLLYESLVEVRANRLAESDVGPVMRIVSTFGFHLAKLDIRQNSGVHDQALQEVLESAGITGVRCTDSSDEGRRRFIDEELLRSRPFLLPGQALPPRAASVLDCFRSLSSHIDRYGDAGLGSLIVSMTRSASDLFVVYLLAREAGLLVKNDSGVLCRLPVVPLFETIDDLHRAPGILRTFLAHPITQCTLAAQGNNGELVQQVMIGYSDSNKDAGITASLWHLNQAQVKLVEVGEEFGVRIRFFHGRGGSISRGAGPTHRFIRALPDKTLNGDLRLTEQGEVIARQYANKLTATHNLELLLASALRETAERSQESVAIAKLPAILDKLAAVSHRTYRGLLEEPGFLDFYRRATPIDVIEHSRIGSRPSRRTGTPTLADLRAIPWVFSWSQARFFLSGWYGAGTAFKMLLTDEPEAFALLQREFLHWPPLHYIVSSIATNLMLTDRSVMDNYALLVLDDENRDRFMKRIMAEHTASMEIMEKLYDGPLREKRPHVEEAISLRRGALRQLHQQQCVLLAKWRDLKEHERTEHPLFTSLLLTVNAIANGLGTTG